MDDKMIKEKFELLQEVVLMYIPKLILAIVILIVGFWLIKRVLGLLEKIMIKRGVDITLIPFIRSISGVALKIILVVSVAELVGFKTTSFVAIIGAAGLAIGLALQGSLSNFAGGALILLFKPFKVGDLIETEGQIGTVKEIQIFNTILISRGNRRTILPNGNVSNNTIINHTAEGKLRVDIAVGIAYGEDIKKARNVMMEVIKKHPKVLEDPQPTVNVMELADSSVNLAIRPFCKPEDYWDVYFDLMEGIKYALDQNEIEIPFPQQVSYEYKMSSK